MTHLFRCSFRRFDDGSAEIDSTLPNESMSSRSTFNMASRREYGDGVAIHRKLGNRCITNGLVPKSLKAAYITYLLKTSTPDKSVLSNYPPASNIAVFSKIPEVC